MSDTYRVIQEEDVATLEFRVNMFMEWGWVPHGPLIVDNSATEYKSYKQVMVKNET